MSKPTMTDRYADAHNLLIAVANQLDQWADESRQGGWRSHQVEPQRELADQIRRFLGVGEVPQFAADRTGRLGIVTAGGAS